MDQTAILQSMVTLYGAIAVWFLTIWIRGLTMQPTPAARELLAQAAADYADPHAVAMRAKMDIIAVEAETQRLSDRQWRLERKLRRLRTKVQDNCGIDILQEPPAS